MIITWNNCCYRDPIKLVLSPSWILLYTANKCYTFSLIKSHKQCDSEYKLSSWWSNTNSIEKRNYTTIEIKPTFHQTFHRTNCTVHNYKANTEMWNVVFSLENSFPRENATQVSTIPEIMQTRLCFSFVYAIKWD